MKRSKYFFIFFCTFSILGAAEESPIISKINNILPEGRSVQSIKESQVKGLYVVDIGDLQPIYASEDGNFFIYGELYSIERGSLLNTTKQEISLNRRAILDSELLEKDFITFQAENEKYVITVFTDVDCGYCRKFHGEIDDYNAQGITVNYVAFPRSGLESESYNKIVGAWCSPNPKESLTALKQGLDPELPLCQDHPVEEHFLLGQRIGITGTPAIISANGDLLPGYLPPMELLKRLRQL
ncbi:MAG: thioredoxin [SAR86 cluster bacterium BACL1 MAG-121105-bin34]|mgnify:FL=1|jgi:thiol:disulfide interchange protein DsbC|uniref:Thiol:disulfide interchange protein n=2 Tax=SAR86 cluster TaxID=62672 RepID=A0A0R2UEB8_9GAMM|nr:MAG: thioredoxin [SAR86 cluster bacterium BACL1 MAG-120507-bin14]KRO37318.1 MAG: thioredoxin [SAR86 cluster bacterium BACL1 MAG-120920-bin57]KRO95389.1 MAG: thioredoxin [SAR86 cluster bacterium BACL1 MAG-120820-bin45]KRO97350.1 MAG: thioredoxin [SAR86 cluster bacterium BACL1 MAG-120828-bin5]KRO98254.1 MAG: thioredoxin [SAR86 cluster bacterium BACL1 MAG-120813-bin36]KRO98359.1 MAG: thioredoxin [SAR86 cluster bacterium BACL1 MAG-120823-bin87]KRP01597.1 MAG: thioredoxin [SAR86 cluster bacteri